VLIGAAAAALVIWAVLALRGSRREGPGGPPGGGPPAAPPPSGPPPAAPPPAAPPTT
jgi:hypothetical protein